MQSDDDSKAAFHGRIDAVYQSLPRLGSPEYLRLLQTASASALPPQVLVRACRELWSVGEREAADRTLERLLGHGERYGYLRIVRAMARRHRSLHDRSVEEDDLVLGTVQRMVPALPGSAGAFAERAWGTFCRQQFWQTWREAYGREGQRGEVAFAEATRDPETGELRNLAEESEGADAPWHVPLERPDEALQRKLDHERFEFLRRTIDRWPEEELRLVARDQFLEEAAAVSGQRRKNGKAPLTEQLGKERDAVNRLIAKARIRLKAALASNRRLDPRDADVTAPGRNLTSAGKPS